MQRATKKLRLDLQSKPMRKGKYKKVLLAATGALMSPTMVNHKLSIPAISHAVSLEVML